MKAYSEDSESVLRSLGADADGLSDEEAGKRLQSHGKNKLQEEKKESLIRRFFSQMADPMTIILLCAAVISGIMSVYEKSFPSDVIIIMVVVVINAILGVLQESKAEKAIEALQKIAAATSKVIRDGKLIHIHSEDLVPGDIVILEAGDAVPADGRLLEAASMKVEESALTGESVPVTKISDVLEERDTDIPLGDRKNMVYMGSTVVYGRGKAVICDTGMDTEMGKIASALSNAGEGKTPLQIKLAQLSKILTYLVIGICVLIFGVNVARELITNGTMTFHSVMDTFMIAVSLAVAAIPEGLATVVTIVLSIGVTNMSKRQAVIRKMTAVETLGCTQIICSDKTGTLTQNKMTVVEHATADETLLLTGMTLCSDAELEGDTADGEPTECALVNDAAKAGLKKPQLKEAMPRIGEAPFDSLRKMMSTVHRSSDGRILQFTKGAPDVVLSRCEYALTNDGIVPFDDRIKEKILDANKQMADKALRVLCLAQRTWDAAPLDCSPEQLEHGLCYVGLCGMIDPVRPEVKDAIAECRRAGVRPVMITGDHKDTAVAIARELGIIENASQAITGTELDAISDEDFADRVRDFSVYARVQPEHKTRIVRAWQALGMVTAMTGDGVNDAPSIKNADIGVGMGITGTDVTKNVADMILADDNFATIVSAVGEGRRIYDNIKKAIQFLLASNLSEVLSIFLSSLFGFTILKPVHLLWINLITDCFPALSLGMEKPEQNIMDRAPRDPKEGIFADGIGFSIAYQGITVTLITMASFFIGRFIECGSWGIGESNCGITMAFLTLSMCEICHSFNMRSLHGSIFRFKEQNKWLWGAAALSLLATTLVIEVPFLAKIFGFFPLSVLEYAIALGLSLLIIPVVELVKLATKGKYETSQK